MRAIEVTQYGGPEVLRVVERPEPAAVPGKVRVQVAARTVNPVDWATRAGAFEAWSPPLPFILGWDYAGTVLDDEAGFLAGDRVVGLLPWFEVGTGEGTYLDTLLADPGWLAPLPADVEFADATTLALNGLTAFQALALLDASPGDTVLITGVSGAVGAFATQLGATAGLQVIAIAGDGDEEYVASLGVKEIIVRSDPASVVEAIRELAPSGVDGVLDPASIGQPLLGAVRDGGTFVAFIDPALPIAERGIRTSKVNVQAHTDQLAGLVAKLASGELKTRVSGVLPLTHAAEAQRRAAAGVRGKIVLIR